jgi:hypothetical protein
VHYEKIPAKNTATASALSLSLSLSQSHSLKTLFIVAIAMVSRELQKFPRALAILVSNSSQIL